MMRAAETALEDMGFILDGLETESYDRTYSDRELLRRIVAYFRPHRLQMLVVAALILLNSVAGSRRRSWCRSA